ncbi:MAG TPA: MEDS domain-containing protein [Gemmatimonadaceae bacterium]|nr:MEDS domain-containing protein [Gemmatimonadaceae bacterium]
MADRHRIRLCGEDVDRPGHICAFFESRDEAYGTLAPYIKQGLDRGEQVISIVDERRRSEHLRRLEAEGIPVDSAIESDRLRVPTVQETYLKGGSFDGDSMYSLLHRTLVTAKKKGRRVRISGDMEWTRQPAISLDRLMEYEARVNILVPTFDCTLLCLYDPHTMSGSGVLHTFATHPFIVLNGRARENPHYVEPLTYLKTRVPARKDSPRTKPKA